MKVGARNVDRTKYGVMRMESRRQFQKSRGCTSKNSGQDVEVDMARTEALATSMLHGTR